MTRERAKRLAAEWSLYHKLFYDLLCQQEQEQNEPITDRKQLTNADRIRAMSDEELACFFAMWCHTTDDCGYCPFRDLDCPVSGEDSAWLKWLQQPAEEGAND